MLAWYDANARDLPWRGEGCTPYRVLVSEAMLQQTQVATVVPYFERFITALRSLGDLAAADEQAVLRLWQGLGYYARARNLHKAAQAIIERHGGELPRTLEELQALPGVGRYTAGAIASIAFDVRAPVLDGNVTRVLCRLEKISGDPRRPDIQRKLWQRAASLVPPKRAGDFNSALMELGATICTPRNPQCAACPLRRSCKSFAAGAQERIPPARSRKPTRLIQRDVFVIRNARSQYVVEQRPPNGRWAGLWQFITRERGGSPPITTTSPVLLGAIKHALTHRRYHFRVFECTSRAAPGRTARWASDEQLDALPMPRPHLRIRAMLASNLTSTLSTVEA